MSDPIQVLSAGVEQFESIQKFQKYCEKQLQAKVAAQGRQDHSGVDLAQALVLDREPNDGNFEIVYRDPAESFFCGAHVSLNNHEMVIRAGISDTQTLQGEGHLEMSDGCSLSKELVGGREEKSQTCVDGSVSPELLREEVLRSPSIQFFSDYCQKQLIDKIQHATGNFPLMPFSLAKTQLINPDDLETTYELRYESLAQDFVCAATIDTQTHSMQIYTGSYEQDPSEGQVTSTELTDACTLTQDLLGKEKAGEHCHDKTREERGWEARLEVLFAGYVNYLGGKWLWGKLVRRMPALKPVPMAGLRAAGNALLVGWAFDKATGLFLAPDNPIRKYGYYAALTGGAFAPVLWKKAAQTQVIQAMTTRALANSVLATGLKKVPAGALGRGFLGVMVLNYGVKWLFGGSDYNAWVNQRITDEIYDEYVYDLDGWDFLLVPLAIKGVRATCRELAPDAIEWAIATDNEDIKTRILQEDAKASMEIREYMRQSLPQLLVSPGFYPPTDPKSYQELDLSVLESSVSQSYLEKVVAAAIQENDLNTIQQKYDLSDAIINDIIAKSNLEQIQKGAAFLAAVDQPLNDWARLLFHEDGSLRHGQGPALLYYLGMGHGDAATSESEIIKTRKVQVLLSYLHGENRFAGAPIEVVMQAAGLVQKDGAVKIDGAYIVTLSLYASEAKKTQDPTRRQRLEAIGARLKWRYLQAPPSQREGIEDALRVLQIDPETVVRKTDSTLPKIEKCFRKDSPHEKMMKIFSRYSLMIRRVKVKN